MFCTTSVLEKCLRFTNQEKFGFTPCSARSKKVIKRKVIAPDQKRKRGKAARAVGLSKTLNMISDNIVYKEKFGFTPYSARSKKV